MVNNEYAIAYAEVLEILNYIPKEEYNKIPKSKIKLFEENASKEYKFYYNPNKTLAEQNVSNITNGIIILLFRDYWATNYQKQKIINKQKYDEAKREEELKQEYDYDNLFKKVSNSNNTEKVEIENQSTELIEYKKSTYRIILNKVKKLFSKKE